MNFADELVDAVNSKDIAFIELLLEKGISINTKIAWGMTVLHYAVSAGQYAMVQILLDKGATVNVKDKSGRTPLHYAALQGNQVIVELLLNRDAAINARNYHGNTPLYEAASQGHQAVVEVLLNKGALADIKDSQGKSPLHRAVWWGHKAVVGVLLTKNVIIDSQDISGITPLHEAVYQDNYAIVELLLNKGANTDTQDEYGDTPLHVATCFGHQSIVELLLNKGAKIDIQNKSRNTPLHEAADMYVTLQSEESYKQIIKLFLNKGAYSYIHESSDQMLHKLWEDPKIDTPADTSFYTALLLAGVGVGGKVLPEPLRTIQSNIEDTVQLWLKPLNLSKEACQEITPNLLRAIPRLNYWDDLIAQDEKMRKPEDMLKSCCATPEEQIIGFKDFLLIPKAEQEGDWLSVLQALQAQSIPVELLVLIRESCIVQLLADTMAKIYQLPYCVAYHVAKEGKACRTNYLALQSELFKYDGSTPHP